MPKRILISSLVLAAATAAAAEPLPGSISLGQWLDRSRDGVRQDGETEPVPAPIPQLEQWMGSAWYQVYTTPTQAGDRRVWSSLVPGRYRARFTTYSPFRFAAADQGGDDSRDSDVAVDGTVELVIADGEALSADAGHVDMTGSISLGQWLDRSRDGVRQDGETEPVPAPAPQLEQWMGSSWYQVYTTPTQVGDRRVWSSLFPGRYRARFTVNPPFRFATADQGGDDARDSDVAADGTVELVIADGEALSVDAGHVDMTGSISLGQWLDRSRDGVRQDGETEPVPAPIPQLEQWMGSSWYQVYTTPTQAGDRRVWSSLVPGRYRARFTTYSPFRFATADQGGDDARDSDVAADGTVELVIADGEALSADAGHVDMTGSISLGQWLDRSRDGVRQDGETEPVPAPIPQLEQWMGSAWYQVYTTPTQAGDRRVWSSLVPGRYRARFTTYSPFRFAAADQGGDDARDSDVAVDGTVELVIADGEVLSADAGHVEMTGSISLGQWLDQNRDGVRQDGELNGFGPSPVLEQWMGSVWMPYSIQPQLVAGRRVWSSLPPAQYRARWYAGGPYRFTIANQGADEARDSDVAADGTVALTIADGEALGADAGYVQALGAIAGRVWFDGDADGVQDAGEPGRAGVAVECRTSAGVVEATATTDADGRYAFPGLVSSTVHVIAMPALVGWLSMPDQGGNDALDSDMSLSGQLSATVVADVAVAIDAGIANQAPLLTAAPLTLFEDGQAGLGVVASDPEGEALAWEVTGAPQHGTLVGTAPGLTYVPAADWSGSDSVGVLVRDPWGRSAAMTVAITVTPVNDAPVLAALPLATTANVAVSGILAGSDREGDALAYAVVGTPALGSATISGDRLDYVPAPNAVGTDCFLVRVTDAGGATAEAEVTVVVTGAGLPVPWALAAIGSVAPAPTIAFDWAAARFSLASAGNGLAARADAAAMLTQAIAGDVTIIAQVATQNGTSAARAGLIFRDSAAVGSRTAAVQVSPTGALSFVRRTTLNGSLATTSGGTPSPARRWLKLARVGTLVTASASADGVTWVKIGSATVALNALIEVGLVGAGGKNGGVSTAGFAAVQVILPAPPAGNG
jgi:predicted phage tail protein